MRHTNYIVNVSKISLFDNILVLLYIKLPSVSPDFVALSSPLVQFSTRSCEWDKEILGLRHLGDIPHIHDPGLWTFHKNYFFIILFFLTVSMLNQTSTEGQGNTGNDHLPKKHVIVRGIPLTSLIENLYKTVWRICIWVLGCKGLSSHAVKNWCVSTFKLKVHTLIFFAAHLRDPYVIF